MKHSLNIEEKNRLDRLITEAEKRTGTQIVLAVIERSDSYAELPWKAFALGASLAGLLALTMSVSSQLNSASKAMLLVIVMILSAGASFALMSVFVPDFARLFLQNHRTDVETKQYAESLFLSREMFATKRRRAVLIMISLFERRVVILPDTGLAEQLHTDAVNTIIRHMRMELRKGRLAFALETGLQEYETLMADSGSSASADDEIPNVIIEEKGA